MKTVAEVIIVLYAFTKSFWLGLGILGIIIVFNHQYKIIKNQLNACLTEEKEKVKMKAKDKTPDKIYPYKNCVIEKYNNCYKVLNTKKNITVDKIYWSMKEAKKDIDTAYPFE